MKRMNFVAVILVLAVCVLPFSAFAEPLNYRDYQTGVTVDGDNDIVYVSLPVDDNIFQLYDGDTLIQSAEDVSSFTWLPSPNKYYYLSIMLVPEGISLHNIPTDTMIRYELSFDGFGTAMQNSRIWDGVYKYDKEGNQEWTGGYVDREFPPDLPLEFEFGLANNHDYVYFYPGVSVYDIGPASDSISITPYTIEVLSVKLTLTISSLYRLQEETGITNDLLTEVNRQLEEQGKTMDDILTEQEKTNDHLDNFINGDIEPETPDGGGAVGDLDNVESGLREDAQSGLEQGLEVQQSALEIVLGYASAFAVVTWIFGLFADIPFFSALLYVSLALGIYAVILSVGLETANKAYRARERDRRLTNRRIIRQSRRN